MALSICPNRTVASVLNISRFMSQETSAEISPQLHSSTAQQHSTFED